MNRWLAVLPTMLLCLGAWDVAEVLTGGALKGYFQRRVDSWFPKPTKTRFERAAETMSGIFDGVANTTERVVNSVGGGVAGTLETNTEWLKGVLWSWLVILFLVASIAAIIVVLVGIMRYVYQRASDYMVRPIVWRLRGISYEAVRPGSGFVPADIPSYQISVRKPGLFADQHSGYCIRVSDDYAVVPRHVMPDGDMVILVGHSGEKIALANPSLTLSVMPDLAYLYVGKSNFAKLGAKVAPPARTDGGHATITGPLGASSGLLRKAQMVGTLCYSGSTVAGMSGAAYVIGSKVVGVHHGVVDGKSYNFGTATQLIAEEVKKLVTFESSEDLGRRAGFYEGDESDVDYGSDGDEDDEDRLGRKGGRRRKRRGIMKRSAWNDEDVTRYVHKVGDVVDGMFVGASWADVIPESALSEGRKAKPKETKVKTKIHVPDASVNLQFIGQNDEEKECVYAVKAQCSCDCSGTIDKMAEDVNKAIVNLETRLATVEKEMVRRAQPADPHPCPEAGCDAVCSSPEKLANHRASSHPVKYTCTQCPYSNVSAALLAEHVKGAHKEPVEFVCVCGEKCRTALRLANHQTHCPKVNMPAFKGESAIPSDTGATSKTVNQRAPSFLGRKSNSPRRTTRRSSRSSTSSAERERSPALEEILSGMTRSLQSIEECLRKTQPSTAGPSSGAQRN